MTEDAGRSWVQLPTVHLLEPRQLLFVDESNGWILARSGAQDTSRAFRVASDDPSLGEFWVGGHRFSLLETSVGVQRRKRKSIFAGDMHYMRGVGAGVMVCGAQGRLGRLRGPGKTLTSIPTPPDADLVDVSAVDDTYVLAAVGGKLLLSLDGGGAWETVRTDVMGELYSVHLCVVRSGVIACQRGLFIFDVQD
jgi:photosystem II stability/assembly factor-like uncharacterized protein